MQLPPHLTRYSGPSTSTGRSLHLSLDYSGADDVAKKIDQLPQAQAAKFAALYGGDIAGSVAADHRIRDLLDAINNPRTPLTRISSIASASSGDASGPSFTGEHPTFDMQTPAGEQTAIAPLPPMPPPPQSQPSPNLPNLTKTAARRSPSAPATDVISDPSGRDARKFSTFA